MNRYQEALLKHPLTENDLYRGDFKNHYYIMKIENPAFKDHVRCKVAVFFNENRDFYDSILRHINADKIIKFMLNFNLIEVLGNEARPRYETFSKRIFVDDGYSVMIVHASEEMFKIWQDFSSYTKAGEREIPIGFRRYGS